MYGYQSCGIATDQGTLVSVVRPGDGWYYTGDLMFEDLTGDGLINSGTGSTWYSMGDMKRLGYTYPRLKYSIGLGLDWKNFSISLLLDGVGKEVRYINNFSIFGATGAADSRQMTQNHLDLGYWSEDTPNAFFPRAYTNGKNFNNTNSQYLLDLAHLRVKNLNIGYNVPAVYLKKCGFTQMTINLSMENLGFIYNKCWSELDPQMIRNGGNGYPIQRTFSLGIRLGI